MKLKNFLAVSAVSTLAFFSVMGVSAASLQDLFDAKYYSDSYADLKTTFGDDEEALYKHFLEYGIEEGRQPSPFFDIQMYKALYPDLQAAFGDDLAAYYEHYLTFGIVEGRIPFQDGFDFREYADRYPDLKEAFGYDAAALYRHYLTYGINEGRKAAPDVVPEAPDVVPETPEDNPSAGSGNISDSDSGRYWLPLSFTQYDTDGNIVESWKYQYDEYGFLNGLGTGESILVSWSNVYDEASGTLRLTIPYGDEMEYYFDETGMLTGSKWGDRPPVQVDKWTEESLRSRPWLNENGEEASERWGDLLTPVILTKTDNRLKLEFVSEVKTPEGYPLSPNQSVLGMASIWKYHSTANDDGTVTTTIYYDTGEIGEVVVWTPATKRGFFQNLCFDWDYTYRDEVTLSTIFWG